MDGYSCAWNADGCTGDAGVRPCEPLQGPERGGHSQAAHLTSMVWLDWYDLAGLGASSCITGVEDVHLRPSGAPDCIFLLGLVLPSAQQPKSTRFAALLLPKLFFIPLPPRSDWIVAETRSSSSIRPLCKAATPSSWRYQAHRTLPHECSRTWRSWPRAWGSRRR